VIMKRAKSGYYGELYESLTPPKVLRWFADYDAERTVYFEDQHRRETDQYRFQAIRLVVRKLPKKPLEK